MTQRCSICNAEGPFQTIDTCYGCAMLYNLATDLNAISSDFAATIDAIADSEDFAMLSYQTEQLAAILVRLDDSIRPLTERTHSND